MTLTLKNDFKICKFLQKYIFSFLPVYVHGSISPILPEVRPDGTQKQEKVLSLTKHGCPLRGHQKLQQTWKIQLRFAIHFEVFSLAFVYSTCAIKKKKKQK